MDAKSALAANEAVFRTVNESVELLNQTFVSSSDTFDIVCECDTASCAQVISVEPATYERARADSTLFLIVPGHEDDHVETIVEQHDRFNLVRKRAGFPGDVAEATDLRP